MNLVVFTCALNEEETIAEVLKRIPTKIPGISKIQKLVVSDGSTDNTAKVARENGAIVIENRSQKRLAYSFQLAVEKALELGCDIAVNIDADLQFNPEDIPNLVAPIVNNEADFVAADRFTDKETGKKRKPKNMPTSKYYSNLVGAWLVGKLSGRNFRDVTCGFRAYTKEALLNINLNSKYTYSQESFQVLAMRKMDIVSVPTDVKYYPGRKSRVVNSFFGFLFGSGLNILKAFRDFAPLTFFGLLGGSLFMIGLVLDIFVLIHFLRTGSFHPYIFLILTGVYLNTLGIIAFIVGLVADMLDRIRNNQEKIMYLCKKEFYDKK